MSILPFAEYELIQGPKPGILYIIRHQMIMKNNVPIGITGNYEVVGTHILSYELISIELKLRLQLLSMK